MTTSTMVDKLVAPALRDVGLSKILEALGNRGGQFGNRNAAKEKPATEAENESGNHQVRFDSPASGGLTRNYIIARLIRDGFAEHLSQGFIPCGRGADESSL